MRNGAAEAADAASATVAPERWPGREPAVAWRCDGLCFRYRGSAADAIDEVSVEIPARECTAIIGPNGSGKSTFLRLLLGTLEPQGGSVEFFERPLAGWSRQELARMIGVVPQREEEVFPLSARELVAMGRYPHLGRWQGETAADRDAVSAAMGRCDIAPLADRLMDTLSGGERQRARLARALAQQPGAFALDEPTTSLDVRHEMAIFELLRALADGGATVLLVTHNLNLAARFADRLLLLERGRMVAAGPPAAVLQSQLLERVYGWPLRIGHHPGPGTDAGAPQVVSLSTAQPAGGNGSTPAQRPSPNTDQTNDR